MGCLLGLALLLAFVQLSTAADWEVGARGGFSFGDDHESFTQYEAFANSPLPWRWRWGGIVDVDTRLTSSLGVLHGGGEAGGLGTLGFGFVFGRNDGPLEILAGSALTMLAGGHVYGEEDLGGPVQFTHHIGAAFRLHDNWSAILQVQHMSNAYLYDENPGINFMTFGLRYRF
jgi:hypothetical protein